MILQAGQVAVVTGAASGIGLAIAQAFAQRGLTVVMADVEQDRLAAAAQQVGGVPRRVDVRSDRELDELAAWVLAEYGRVDVMCNNAGVVTARQPVWQQSCADWRWTVDVNLLGVANGVRAFVPHMIGAGRGHVVNTASIAGLATIPGGGNGAYSATKHAIVGLSETLLLELAMVAPEVGVTVLCPGPVPSRIHDAARNRPVELGPDAPVDEPPKTDFGLRLAPVDAAVVAARVLQAIEERTFYLLPAADTVPMARARVAALLHDLAES